ncbi:CGNR zinc finger domain-containing protein [Labedaea rhizosphaerae]|uniref:CGNR zinc finger domain-containing protein n=1 Tax=Labedaea rhizosphaerae TaxID=598644 RepID=UPI001AAD92A6|nr:CGNR zinc finger domain-containing protein [Labedaea rhizosphaerae]
MATTDQRTRTRITAQLRALRFDAGSLSLNLAATVARRGETEVERLTGPERLAEWCAGVGVDLRAADRTPEFVARLHELRAAVYDVLAASVRDRLPDKASVALVNEVAAVAPPAATLRGTRVEPPVLTGAELRSLIARDLLDVLADPSRLRECDSELCRMIYVDSPGGRPRKWCSMQRCGNRAKAAQHRRKAGAAPA